MTYNLTKKQQEAFECMKLGQSVFLTGPGGSGKSYLLKYFIEWYRQNEETPKTQIYITSTTGLSAILIDGMTINRYSGIGIGDKDINIHLKKINTMPHLKKRWQNTSVLIIDEISMMDADIFDKIEILAQKIRKRADPFGGIQIILSGDFLQLPPVKSENFCFEAFSWDTVINKIFYFDEILRQDDTKLQAILNSVRLGIVNEDVRLVLDSRLNKKLDNKDGIIPTLLFSKKDMVSEYNEDELQKLISVGNEHIVYQSKYEFNKNINDENKKIYKDLLNNQYQIDDILTLVKNNQVMLTVNMPDHGLANGSRGIITNFLNGNPVVLFLNGVVLEILPKEYILDEDGQSAKKIMIPLIHAWAITIHKAQGMSLEFVKTDIGESIFEYGQAYVVLSRITNIEGLSLLNIDYSKIKAHPKILKYYSRLDTLI